MLRAQVLGLLDDQRWAGGVRWDHVWAHSGPHVPQPRRPRGPHQGRPAEGPAQCRSAPPLMPFSMKFSRFFFIFLIFDCSNSSYLLTAKILPVVKNQHLLLCTLLIGNSLAMEVFFLQSKFLIFLFF